MVGPTASGKTSLAVKLGQRFSANLVNADATQVYKGFDIISGKDIPKGSELVINKALTSKISNSSFQLGYYAVDTIPIYLLDIVDPSYPFNVSDYVKVAVPTINYISSKQKFPIIVGGSGFYIRCLVNGPETIIIPPNITLREELAKKSTKELQKILEENDKEKVKSMNNSDRKNPRRLIRAIEIVLFKAKNAGIKKAWKLRGYDILIIGLYADREIIKHRIDQRIEARLKNGAVEEAKSLFNNYGNLSSQVKTANGYQQFFNYFRGEIPSLDETIKAWKQAEYKNAKKQMTYFQKNKHIRWFDITDAKYPINIFDGVEEWLDI